MMYLLRSKNIKIKMISNIPKQIIFCGGSTISDKMRRVVKNRVIQMDS
jgi:hypothetical protein